MKKSGFLDIYSSYRKSTKTNLIIIPLGYLILLFSCFFILVLPRFLEATPLNISLHTGLNLFGYPVEIPPGYSAYDLITTLGNKDEVNKVQQYDPNTKTYWTASYADNGMADGDDFDIENGQGYLVYMKAAKSVPFDGLIMNPIIPLKKGLNIVSIPNTPLGYTSYDLLSYLGPPIDKIKSIRRFNKKTGSFETTTYFWGRPSGNKFTISYDEAYLMHMKSDKVLSTTYINTPPPFILGTVFDAKGKGLSIEVIASSEAVVKLDFWTQEDIDGGSSQASKVKPAKFVRDQGNGIAVFRLEGITFDKNVALVVLNATRDYSEIPYNPAEVTEQSDALKLDQHLYEMFQSANEGDIYVSTTGSNTTGDGSRENPYQTISHGLDVSSSGDIIVVMNGLYIISSQIQINSDDNGKTLISEYGPDNCIIDGDDDGRCFKFTDVDSSFTLHGFTIQHGQISGYDNNRGGGIFCDHSSPLITKCILRDNRAQASGGGMCCENASSPTITECTISGNRAHGETGLGGGIYCSGSTITISRCSILANSATQYNGGGICIAFNSVGSIENCIVSGNKAANRCGGVFSHTSTTTITNCTISGNNSPDGAVRFYGGTATITNCIISSNSSNYGIYNGIFGGVGANLTISYTDIYDHDVNDAYNEGTLGAVSDFSSWGWSGLGCISQAPQFTGGALPSSAGYYYADDWSDYDFHLDHTSPCRGTGTSNGAPATDLDGTARPPFGVDMGAYEQTGSKNITPMAVNLNQVVTYSKDDTAVALAGITITDADADDEVTAILVLDNKATGALPENDGSSYDQETGTWTMTGTVAQVNNALANLDFIPDDDPGNNDDTFIYMHIELDDGSHSNVQTGLIYMLLDFTALYGGDWYVSPQGSDTTGDGSEPNPFETIQHALEVSSSGETIVLLDGTYLLNSTIEVFSKDNGKFIISKNGRENCIIDGNNTFRCFYFYGVDSSFRVNGVTIQHGYATGSYPDNKGGGIYFHLSSPKITNCLITENSSPHSGGGIGCRGDISSPLLYNCTISHNTADASYYGGGMYCETGSSTTLYLCTISENTAHYGGALAASNSSALITRCTITNNSAYCGGGIYTYGNCSPEISDCTIEENTATIGGGIYCNFQSQAFITECTISNNTADSGGGMFCVDFCCPTISECTIHDNTASSYNGGGIEFDFCTMPSVINCTISGNTAGSDGGSCDASIN